MDIARLKIDPTKERGTWVPIDPTCQVKIAYTNSKEYKRALRTKLRPFAATLEKTRDYDSIPDEQQDKIAIQMLLDHTLFDWKGVQEGDVDVPFTRENAERILIEAPAFRELIETAAATLTNFRFEQRTEAAKNSETASAGS